MLAAKSNTSIRLLRRAMVGGALLTGLALASASAHAWGWGSTIKGSGNVVTSTRSLSGFQGVELNLPAEVKLVQGPVESVLLETDDNIAPLVETVVERGQLLIRPAKRGENIQTKTLRLTVTAPGFTKLSVAGSGTIKAETLQTTRLQASISGSGDIQILKLDAGELAISIAGSGDFEAKGHADQVEASIAGSGDVRTANLQSKRVKVNIAGSGDAAVWATEALHISVAGSGDVKYYGDATVSKSIAGSGSVRRLGDKP